MKIRFFFFFMCLQVAFFGQTSEASGFFKKREFGLQLSGFVGFLTVHRPDMAHIPKQRVHGISASLVFYPKNDKSWQLSMRKISYGFNFQHNGGGNDQIIGKLFAATSFLEIPIIRLKNSNVYWVYALGIGYATKRFDQQNNPKNITIGTKLNASSYTGIGLRKRFGSVELNTSIELHHWSNGAFKVPNLGLNIPMFKLGVCKVISQKVKPIFLEKVNPVKSWRFNAMFIASTRQYFPTGNKNHAILGVMFQAAKQVTAKFGYETSLDFINNRTILEYKTEFPKKWSDLVQIGLYGGVFLPVDRLHLFLGFGYYVRDIYVPSGKVYTRFGVKYYVNDTWLINFNVKANWGRADYIDFGVGYSIFKPKKQ